VSLSVFHSNAAVTITFSLDSLWKRLAEARPQCRAGSINLKCRRCNKKQCKIAWVHRRGGGRRSCMAVEVSTSRALSSGCCTHAHLETNGCRSSVATLSNLLVKRNGGSQSQGNSGAAARHVAARRTRARA